MKQNEKPFVIALDLGGTNSVFGIVDSSGEIKASTSIKTQAYTTVEEYVAASCQAVMTIVEETGGMENIKAMGIGAPSANYYRGTIENAANLVWGKGIVPLAKLFEDKLGVPVALTNDANAAALGEKWYGVAQGMNNFVEITLGTGVGSGIVVNGLLLYGCDGFAGELGHMIVTPVNGRPCGCGRSGCLETYCSATGVVRTAKEMLANNPDTTSSLKNIPLDKLTSLDIYNEAMKQDELALQIFKQTGEMIGEACANVATVLSPEAFIFFGGLANAGDLLMNPIKEAYEKHVLSLYQGKAKFLISGLKGASAAVLGASAMAWEI